MDAKTILEDLKRLVGDKTMLSPEDLATIIRISPKTQANMRSDGRFPLPVKKLGRDVFVSIYDLADYLAKPSKPTKTASPVIDMKDKNTKYRRESIARLIAEFQTQNAFFSALIANLESDLLTEQHNDLPPRPTTEL